MRAYRTCIARGTRIFLETIVTVSLPTMKKKTVPGIHVWTSPFKILDDILANDIACCSGRLHDELSPNNGFHLSAHRTANRNQCPLRLKQHSLLLDMDSDTAPKDHSSHSTANSKEPTISFSNAGRHFGIKN